MFSGIITEIGQIVKINESNGKIFTVLCNKTLNNLKLGNSVAINGACHTVTEINLNNFSFYSSTETLKLTNLKFLKIKNYVNLERPLKINQDINGHLVQGHIDKTAKILKIIKVKNQWDIFVISTSDVTNLMIYKGSVAIDGVSLTINELFNKNFKITIIPSTYKNTIFKYYLEGSIVNIEIDLIAKYIQRFTKSNENKS